MKLLERHRPSVLVALIFITGVLALVPADQTSALSRGPSGTVKTNVFESPLEENEQKIKQLETTFEVKEGLIENKAEDVKSVESETDKAERLKAELAAEVAKNKAEIESLKEQIRLKKEREAAIAAAKAPVVTRGFVPGNGYVPGQCTWYVKNKRPDIGNYWGNADRWIYSAQADGFSIGDRPKIGAIAQAKGRMHVAYVEDVSGDMVTVTEMNYNFIPFNMNTRTVHYSEFTYIYGK